MLTSASILKNTFGYDTFLPMQQEVIESVLAKRDTLAVLPTGGGKSLCYQIPALLTTGLTVVVSPLIALMKDQVEQLQARHVPAIFLNSTLSYQEYRANLEDLQNGEVRLLYVAPETLLTPRIFSLLDTLTIHLITIDEAHCISEWGHDFRPEYRQLSEVRRRYPQAVCLALTATATPRVRADIQSMLAFHQPNEFIASFNRPNLFLEVQPRVDAHYQVLHFLQAHAHQAGIIYCFSRKEVDELALFLNHKGFSARPYHAGLLDAERKANQEAFTRDEVQIIVATIAFGMGIDKPNVRFILHTSLPKSVESYYQEIGRAGRDGLPAHCLLIYGYGDVAKQRYFIDQKEGVERQVALHHLDSMLEYAQNSKICRRKQLLNYFGESYPPGRQSLLPETAIHCGGCDICRPTSIARPASVKSKPLTPKAQPVSRKPEEIREFNHALYALLRQKRKELAETEDIPISRFFSDEVLIEMAARLPKTLQELRAVPGIDHDKLAHHGPAFLAVVGTYCARHKLPSGESGSAAQTSGGKTR